MHPTMKGPKLPLLRPPSNTSSHKPKPTCLEDITKVHIGITTPKAEARVDLPNHPPQPPNPDLPLIPPDHTTPVGVIYKGSLPPGRTSPQNSGCWILSNMVIIWSSVTHLPTFHLANTDFPHNIQSCSGKKYKHSSKKELYNPFHSTNRAREFIHYTSLFRKRLCHWDQFWISDP